MFTIEFLKAAGERAIRTFAQTLLAVIGVTGIGFGDVDWVAAFSVAGVATIASILTSVLASATGESSTPSFTRAETLSDAKHVAQ
jgi:hypothetical protein